MVAALAEAKVPAELIVKERGRASLADNQRRSESDGRLVRQAIGRQVVRGARVARFPLGTRRPCAGGGIHHQLPTPLMADAKPSSPAHRLARPVSRLHRGGHVPRELRGRLRRHAPIVLTHRNTFCSYADTIMPSFFFAVGFAFSAHVRPPRAKRPAWRRPICTSSADC